MSKKVLLEEKATRRMMELAKLGNYSEKFLTESMGYEEEEELEEEGAPPADVARRPETGHQEEEMEVDVDAGEGEGSEDKEEMLKKVVQAVADALGVEVEVGGDVDGEDLGDLDVDMGDGEEMGDEEDMEDEADEEDELDEMSHGGMEEEEEEELDEAKHEEEEEEEEEEMDESRLSEDDLVENVLKRVTARLIAEAKKKGGKETKKKEDKKAKDVKKKMADKKAAKKKEALDEELKGTNLATKGKNKDKTYPGHEDMEYKKGTGKGGKGGHAYSELKTKGEHTVTHKKK